MIKIKFHYLDIYLSIKQFLPCGFIFIHIYIYKYTIDIIIYILIFIKIVYKHITF